MKKDNNNASVASLIIPGATVFVSSFCIMVLELVAARIIARHLGSSLYTWTAIIGVVLAGISFGNYLGGRIADRCQARKTLAILFAISSGTCVLIVVLNNLVGEWTWLWHLSWPTRVFTHVFLVFMLPSTILGTISPVVAKMALDRGLPAGRTVGNIYAWGTVGSIAGTFAAGYWLIPAMGVVANIWAVGSILLLMALFYCVRHWTFFVWAIVFLCTMAVGNTTILWCQNVGVALAFREVPDPRVIYHDETPYCYLSVKRLSEQPDKRVFVQDKLVHSKIVMGDITNLQYFYTQIYAALTQELCAQKETLAVMVIGGGGYVYPRYVEKIWPGSTIDVIEIDPGVTKAATEAFGLERDTTIRTLTMDARNYVDGLLQQKRTGKIMLYDFIYGDACNDYSIPYQLVTKEFNDKISRILAPEGVYMLTIIDTYDSGKFLGAVVNTFQQTFPNTYVLTEGRMPKWARNTFVIVASRQKLDFQNIISKYQKTIDLWCLSRSDINTLKEKSNGLILTDNYAPAENLLAPVVCQGAKEILAYEHINRAEKLVLLGRLEESITNYKKAAETKPQLTEEMYNQIGLICIRQEDYFRAIDAFKKALEYSEQTRAGRNIANVHLNMAVALQKSGQEKEAGNYALKAADSFRMSIQKDPNSVTGYVELGSALLILGDLEAAARAFERAVSLNPADLSTTLTLVKALELNECYDEAIKLLRMTIDYFQVKGQSKQVAELRKYLDILESKKETSPNTAR
jgi:predicted membrane-bound spermidine synthase